MDRHLPDLLVRYGPPLLFFAQMFGIFGLPIPDELLLTIAGALVRRGTLHGPSTLASAAAGCLAGITLSYAVGRTVGLQALQRIAGAREALPRAQAWFKRFGKWVLVFGYFVPGVRHVTAIAAGSAPLDYQEFAAFAYPAGVAWSATFVGVGYFAGDRWEQAAAAARGHLVVAAIVLALFAAAAYAIGRRRERE